MIITSYARLLHLASTKSNLRHVRSCGVSWMWLGLLWGEEVGESCGFAFPVLTLTSWLFASSNPLTHTGDPADTAPEDHSIFPRILDDTIIQIITNDASNAFVTRYGDFPYTLPADLTVCCATSNWIKSYNKFWKHHVFLKGHYPERGIPATLTLPLLWLYQGDSSCAILRQSDNHNIRDVFLWPGARTLVPKILEDYKVQRGRRGKISIETLG